MANCHWRTWIRPLALSIYGLILIILLPILIAELNAFNAQTHVIGWATGGVFMIFTLPICLWNIFSHLRYYTNPVLQRYIIRINWMVPIYSVNAWFALKYSGSAIYLDTLRECYEAFVIYSFMAYLLKYLYGNYPDLDLHLEERPSVKHLFPVCWVPEWKMGRTIIRRCKHGVLQYVVIRPIATAFALIFEASNVYHEGNFSFTNGWTYIVIVNNFSQMLALYCLVLFYKATKEELRPIKPVWKFGCVKAVVFLAFWQGVAIAILMKIGIIQESEVASLGFDKLQDVATSFQDFLICIEMFFISIAFLYAFSYRPFIPGEGQEGPPLIQSFTSMWDFGDVRRDVVGHIKVVGSEVSRFGERGAGSLANLFESTTPFKKSTPNSLKIHFSSLLKKELENERRPLIGGSGPSETSPSDISLATSPLPSTQSNLNPTSYFAIAAGTENSYSPATYDVNQSNDIPTYFELTDIKDRSSHDNINDQKSSTSAIDLIHDVDSNDRHALNDYFADESDGLSHQPVEPSTSSMAQNDVTDTTTLNVSTSHDDGTTRRNQRRRYLSDEERNVATDHDNGNLITLNTTSNDVEERSIDERNVTVSPERNNLPSNITSSNRGRMESPLDDENGFFIVRRDSDGDDSNNQPMLI